MTRHELEIKITEAVDGLLNSAERAELRDKLKAYPDLMEAWELIEQPVALQNAFPEKEPDPAGLQTLRSRMSPGFNTAVIQLFPKYLAAAGIAAALLIGIIRMDTTRAQISDSYVHEWLHPAEFDLAFQDMDPFIIPDENGNGD